MSDLERRGSLVEELRIDGHQADLVPFNVSSSGAVAVAADGSVAVAQMQDHVVRYFGPGGEPLGEFGGEGRGPGEFMRNVRIGWLADTLWIHDAELERITLVTPERTLSRTIPIPPEAHPAPGDAGRVPGSPFMYPFGLKPGGLLMALVVPRADQPLPAPFREHIFFADVASDGIIAQVVAVMPTGETQVRDGRGSTATLPFANRTVYDVSRDGRLAAFARATVDPKSPVVSVSVFDRAADTIFTRQYPLELVPLPEAVRDSVFDRVIAMVEARIPSLVDELRDRAGSASIYPPLQDLIVGRDGTIWVALADRDGERPYLALDPDGDPLGRVHLRARSRIAEAERDRIWVIEPDALDVESLVRYRVNW
jgi:hypothetical protein